MQVFGGQNEVSILISQYLYKGHFPLIVKSTYAWDYTATWEFWKHIRTGIWMPRFQSQFYHWLATNLSNSCTVQSLSLVIDQLRNVGPFQNLQLIYWISMKCLFWVSTWGVVQAPHLGFLLSKSTLFRKMLCK